MAGRRLRQKAKNDARQQLCDTAPMYIPTAEMSSVQHFKASGSFLAEISVRSPWKSFIFINKRDLSWIKVSKNTCYLFENRRTDGVGAWCIVSPDQTWLCRENVTKWKKRNEKKWFFFINKRDLSWIKVSKNTCYLFENRRTDGVGASCIVSPDQTWLCQENPKPVCRAEDLLCAVFFQRRVSAPLSSCVMVWRVYRVTWQYVSLALSAVTSVFVGDEWIVFSGLPEKNAFLFRNISITGATFYSRNVLFDFECNIAGCVQCFLFGRIIG